MIEELILELTLLYKLINDLLTRKGRRIREVFTSLISPIYDRFVSIHLKYRDLFTETMERFPVLMTKKRWKTKQGDVYELDDPRIRAMIEETKEIFFTDRKKEMHIRDWLRRDSQSLLLCVKQKEEKRFLYLLINYFVRDGMDDKDPVWWLDAKIAKIEEVGGFTFFSSPSLALGYRLKSAKDPGQVVNSALDDLDNRFFLVSDAYVKLKYCVLNGL